jgi:hypothetical protein
VGSVRGYQLPADGLAPRPSRAQRRRLAKGGSKRRVLSIAGTAALGAPLLAGLVQMAGTDGAAGSSNATTTYTVNTTQTTGPDDCATGGSCSFPQAVAAYDDGTGSAPVVIGFSVQGTFGLGGKVTIDNTSGAPLSIVGNPHIILSGTSDDGEGLLAIDEGGGTGAVTISGLTLEGGDAVDGTYPYFDEDGGAIENAGSLSLDDVTIKNNSAIYGGGIDNSGSLVIDKSTISGNDADQGGGIYNSGTIWLYQTSILNNDASATGGGGGIYEDGGTLHDSQSTIADNEPDNTASS